MTQEMARSETKLDRSWKHLLQAPTGEQECFMHFSSVSKLMDDYYYHRLFILILFQGRQEGGGVLKGHFAPGIQFAGAPEGGRIKFVFWII